MNGTCRSSKCLVIPAKAGIQNGKWWQRFWIPAFAGMTRTLKYFNQLAP